MKKLLAITLSLIMILTIVSCGNNAEPADTSADTSASVDNSLPFNITVISGTTGMGFAKMMSDTKSGASSFPYNFEIVSGADVVAPAIIGKSTDIAAVPTNLASVLYNKTDGGIVVLAANTLGVLYLIENGEEINTVADLKGKTVYCCQQGANPEYISSYIFTQSGLEVGKDVILDFTYNTPDELATAVATGIVDNAVLPEPKVTATLSQNESLRRALDFSDIWAEVSEGEALIQGCIIARKEFVEAHPAEIALFLEEYKASIEFVNTNVAEAATMIAEAGIIPKAPLAQKAIPNCNIAFLSGNDLIAPMTSFWMVLYDANPASVGGNIPSENIFYK